jgi:hypothetical protein
MIAFLHDRVAVIGVLAGGHLPVPTASSRPQAAETAATRAVESRAYSESRTQVLRSEDARIKKIEHFRNSARGNSSEGWR